jgi:hypothetical protein
MRVSIGRAQEAGNLHLGKVSLESCSRRSEWNRLDCGPLAGEEPQT